MKRCVVILAMLLTNIAFGQKAVNFNVKKLKLSLDWHLTVLAEYLRQQSHFQTINTAHTL